MSNIQYPSHIIKKEHLCPFCSKTFSLLDSPFRFGRNDVSLDSLEVDPYLKEYWYDEELYPPVYLPSKSEAVCLSINVTNDTNRECILIDRLCANCHKKLPLHFFELDTFRFAVIGSRHSGKSTFVRALMNSVANHLNYYKNAIVTEADPDDMLRKKALNESEIIEATYLSFQIPIIYLINDMVKNKKYFLSLYDISGEVFEHSKVDPVGERLKKYAHYLPYSNGCIFLLDPIQMKPIRVQFEQKGKESQLTSTYQEQREVLIHTNQFLTQSRLINPLAQTDQKACICFSKKDILEDQLLVSLTPTSNIPQNAPKEISNALKQYAQQTTDVINNLGATEFLSTFKGFFPNPDQSLYAFAISTMNANLKENAQNIEYPILWMCEMLDNLGQSTTKVIASPITEAFVPVKNSGKKNSKNIMIVILAMILLILTILSFSSEIHHIVDLLFKSDTTINQPIKDPTKTKKIDEQTKPKDSSPLTPPTPIVSKPKIESKTIDECNESNVSKFHMSIREVSVQEYHQCVLSKSCSEPELAEKGCTYTDIEANKDLPINCISFEQANAFAKWVEMSLPTQSQWQCAATSSGMYKKSYWGNAPITCEYANYKDCKHAKPVENCSIKNSKTTVGICDLFGNVAEFIDNGSVVGGHYASPKKDVSISQIIANAKPSPYIGIRLIK